MYLKLILMLVLGLVFSGAAYGQSENSPSKNPQDTPTYYDVVSNSEGHKELLRIPASQLLFKLTPVYDDQGRQVTISLSLKPELGDFYHKVGLLDKPKDTVFIYPSFTQAAYEHNGFYDYYAKKCDSKCLTIPIPDKVQGTFSSSIIGGSILEFLGFPYVMDQDVDKNPDVLKQYKRVIVLHSEYVTQKEFDAITSHPDVIFLYPNALYARVTTNYDDNTITLVRGHGYPDISIRNGFGWKYDNSRYEYDVQCNDWNFYSKGNHTMLNCYPEYKLLTSNVMLELLRNNDPTTLRDDVADWLMYPQDANTTDNLLADFDIEGTIIPAWVQNPALWLENDQITRSEFYSILHYLSENQIIQ